MDKEARYKEFIERFDGPIERDLALAPFTTFRTGGAADLFIDAAEPGQIAQAIKLVRELDFPYFVIGGGSNLLISDSGYRGLIIRNNIRFREVKGNELRVGAGEELDRIVDFATECSLGGLEFAAGIWGTIGGAIYGNAGAFGSEVAEVLAWAELIDNNGNMRRETGEYFEFSYRHSKLKKTGEIVTRAGFGLVAGDAKEIARRVDEIRNLRCQKHPTESISAGCFFKNVEDASQPHGKLPAGKLLEEIGAKQIRVGKAAVFDKHANIIINTGGATSKDIRQLADILKEKVKEKFNIELQEEVISLGDFN